MSNLQKPGYHALCQETVSSNLEILKKEISPEIAGLIKQGNVAFEDPERSTNISIDDVSSKKQKEKREDKDTASNNDTDNNTNTIPRKKKRKYVYNTIAHIENKQGEYTLTGLGIGSVVSILVAFLLNNGLLADNWIFFLDGQRSLYSTLIKSLSWRGTITFILDWYHLKKKCEMQLSLGLNNREKRNEILDKILLYSWPGLIEKVYEVIDNIPEEYIKDQEALDKLKGYYQRNYNYIPNYALRNKIGLRNSSNRGEKENDLIISKRQKDNGMSWSKKGSSSLGLLTAVGRNKEMNSWLDNGQIDFKFAA